MVEIKLGREEIEEAIEVYVKTKVLSYGNQDDYEIKITQGKAASATITLKPKQAPLPELSNEESQV